MSQDTTCQGCKFNALALPIPNAVSWLHTCTPYTWGWQMLSLDPTVYLYCTSWTLLLSCGKQYSYQLRHVTIWLTYVYLHVQAMQRIAAASNLIRDLIGPFCSTLAVALLERGFDLGREVLPAIMHALAAGPGFTLPSQGRHPVYYLCKRHITPVQCWATIKVATLWSARDLIWRLSDANHIGWPNTNIFVSHPRQCCIDTHGRSSTSVKVMRPGSIHCPPCLC